MAALSLFRCFVQPRFNNSVESGRKTFQRILKLSHQQQRQHKRCLATIQNVKRLDKGVSVEFNDNEKHKL